MATNVLETIIQQTEDDLRRFDLVQDVDVATKRALNKIILSKSSGFIRYVISVATHPIGLRASVNPYNSTREHMLAYIIDMFSLSEAKLRKILTTNDGMNKNPNLDGFAKSPVQVLESPIEKKRHSWRPELRLKLCPPAFFYKEQLYLDNLFVRVFLFKDEQIIHSKGDVSTLNLDNPTARAKRVLDYIFKGLKLSSSTLIRPVNEMRYLIRFESPPHVENGATKKPSRANYKMIQVLTETTKSYSDLQLNIRRYYCEPKSAHILRLEFWLNSDVKQAGYFGWYRRFARRLVHSRRCFACFTGNQRRDLRYINENQEFYGFININLTQLPSYPTKQNYPIISIREQKINSCELSIDLRNRRILADDHLDDDSPRSSPRQDPPKKSIRAFLINHVRLYVNCLIYQSLAYTKESSGVSMRAEAPFNLILDNLFYLPAFTLINQHRLQSNLDQFGDRCLRRVAILLVLIKLENIHHPKTNFIKILFLSVIQNEYMVTWRPVDDRTMQEVDPFGDSFESKGLRALIAELELITLRNFVVKFLNLKLEQWFTKQLQQSTTNSDRIVTLSSLKLFRTATYYIRRCIRADKTLHKLLREVDAIKKLVDQVLCRLVVEYLQEKLQEVCQLEGAARNQRNVSNLWLKLLQDVHQIDRDLSLHWRRGGLNILVKKEEEFVSKLELFRGLPGNDFIRLLEEKVATYID